MDEKLKALWSSNKLVFFLILPLALVLIFRDVLLSFLINDAKKTTDAAQSQDSQIQAQAQQAAQAASQAQAAAQADAQRVADRKEDDVPEDWNKKE